MRGPAPDFEDKWCFKRDPVDDWLLSLTLSLISVTWRAAGRLPCSLRHRLPANSGSQEPGPVSDFIDSPWAQVLWFHLEGPGVREADGSWGFFGFLFCPWFCLLFTDF